MTSPFPDMEKITESSRFSMVHTKLLTFAAFSAPDICTKTSQLNKDGVIEGAHARIWWVTFSKSGQTVYYLGRELTKLKGRSVRGNFIDRSTREEFWVSGVKKRGSNAHPAERGVSILIDADAEAEYQAIRLQGSAA